MRPLRRKLQFKRMVTNNGAGIALKDQSKADSGETTRTDRHRTL